MDKPILLVLSAIVLNCFNSPTQLNGQHALDCSKPTISAASASNTTGVTGIAEIYDFEQRLIAFSPLTMASNKVFYTWDGTGMDGKPVGPGKYISKISITDHARGKSECMCSEIYIAPQ